MEKETNLFLNQIHKFIKKKTNCYIKNLHDTDFTKLLVINLKKITLIKYK